MTRSVDQLLFTAPDVYINLKVALKIFPVAQLHAVDEFPEQ